jgi:PIN domain nuclease of toxin-antitoxin system
LIVLDSSALLTVVKKERGADVVENAFGDAAISVVNVTEVITKVWDWGLDANAYVRNLAALSLEFVDFNLARAAQAGRLRSATRSLGLSLGDRACIALAIELNCPVMTADRNWAKLNIGVPIQLIR